jgi:two-component system invasion response regulator UvrY
MKNNTTDTESGKIFSMIGKEKIKILIADNHEIFHEILRRIISGTPEMIVAAEANNGSEVLKMLNNGNFDLVIMDIEMSDRNGFDILNEIKNKKPAPPVLILSMFPEEQYAASAFNNGADGYVMKASMVDELVDAIRMIMQGKKYFNVINS